MYFLTLLLCMVGPGLAYVDYIDRLHAEGDTEQFKSATMLFFSAANIKAELIGPEVRFSGSRVAIDEGHNLTYILVDNKADYYYVSTQCRPGICTIVVPKKLKGAEITWRAHTQQSWRLGALQLASGTIYAGDRALDDFTCTEQSSIITGLQTVVDSNGMAQYNYSASLTTLSLNIPQCFRINLGGNKTVSIEIELETIYRDLTFQTGDSMSYNWEHAIATPQPNYLANTIPETQQAAFNDEILSSGWSHTVSGAANKPLRQGDYCKFTVEDWNDHYQGSYHAGADIRQTDDAIKDSAGRQPPLDQWLEVYGSNCQDAGYGYQNWDNFNIDRWIVNNESFCKDSPVGTTKTKIPWTDKFHPNSFNPPVSACLSEFVNSANVIVQAQNGYNTINGATGTSPYDNPYERLSRVTASALFKLKAGTVDLATALRFSPHRGLKCTSSTTHTSYGNCDAGMTHCRCRTAHLSTRKQTWTSNLIYPTNYWYWTKIASAATYANVRVSVKVGNEETHRTVSTIAIAGNKIQTREVSLNGGGVGASSMLKFSPSNTGFKLEGLGDDSGWFTYEGAGGMNPQPKFLNSLGDFVPGASLRHTTTDISIAADMICQWNDTTKPCISSQRDANMQAQPKSATISEIHNNEKQPTSIYIPEFRAIQMPDKNHWELSGLRRTVRAGSTGISIMFWLTGMFDRIYAIERKLKPADCSVIAVTGCGFGCVRGFSVTFVARSSEGDGVASLVTDDLNVTIVAGAAPRLTSTKTSYVFSARTELGQLNPNMTLTLHGSGENSCVLKLPSVSLEKELATMTASPVIPTDFTNQPTITPPEKSSTTTSVGLIVGLAIGIPAALGIAYSFTQS
jgi:hypothetical protein